MNISQTILTKATERGPNKSTCPSEIARQMFPADWRNHMQEVRDAAIELQKEGKVIITQKGEPVDVDHIKGPVRISIVKL
ncbi:DUF3253 domain-containing protein [Mucilaginibacter terrenus]|uniref:DUF3253 domain-containing protein n=1 Tax=Mucilaginibacter terrenus TaxID=2482727 RepID=UPI00197C0530|nr:DUF3253 domain-containing protein [Mucilaginibacter terrenus]